MADPTAEHILLGCALAHDEARADILAGCKETDFEIAVHRLIYRVLYELDRKQIPVDTQMVYRECRKLDPSMELDASYIVNLYQCVGTSSYWEPYLLELKEHSAKRQIRYLAQKSEFELKDQDPWLLIESMQKELHRISQGNQGSEFGRLTDLVPLSALYKSPRRADRLSTGFPRLDKMLGGLAGGRVVVIAARTSMGKSAFTQSILANLCEEVCVGGFSFEMTPLEVRQRIACNRACVALDRLLDGELDEMEMSMIEDQEDSCFRVVLHKGGSCALHELKGTIRRMVQMYHIQVVMIDYIQQLKVLGAKEKHLEIAEITRSLKEIAVDLNICILAVAQLNRQSELRNNKRPVLSDLRDSGSIEMDADQVLLLYRPDYYDPLDKPGQAEIIVAKNRHGETGKIPFKFQKEFCRFEEVEQNGARW